MSGYFTGESESPCPYIKGEVFRSESYVLDDVGEDEIDILLSRGYRHFGRYFFRPVCRTCHKCLPIRIPLRSYRFSRNAKRLFRKNRGFDIRIIDAPSPGEEHFNLYRKHKLRFPEEDDHAETFETFAEAFFTNHVFSKTMEIRDSGKLVAVTHLDWGRNSVSAVYCYYDTDYLEHSPGRFSIYKGMELASAYEKEYYYLGYYIKDNPHMSYKGDYRPHEILLEENNWIEDTGEEYGFKPRFRLF